MEYRNLTGKSFGELEDELNEDEDVTMESSRDIQIQQDLDRKKQFKQEKRG